MWGTEQWGLVALGGFMAFISNVLYMWGGTVGFGLWWRRFAGSAVLASAASIVAIALGVWTWQYLLFYPFLILGFSLGYGGDDITMKIMKRLLFAFGVLLSCVVGLFITGFSVAGYVVAWLAFLTGLTSVVLGVWNPFKSATLEQFIISQILTLYIPFWAYVIK